MVAFVESMELDQLYVLTYTCSQSVSKYLEQFIPLRFSPAVLMHRCFGGAPSKAALLPLLEWK